MSWVLGVDYGTVRIGLAMGDPESGLVLPLPVLPHPGDEDAVVESLAEVARARDAAEVVLGDPVFMSGAPSPMSHTVARLRERLEAALGLPVRLADERLTSAEAEASLADLGLRWWQVEKGRVDALAAMSIVRQHLLVLNPALGLSTTVEEPPEPPASGLDERAKAARRERRKRSRGQGGRS